MDTLRTPDDRFEGLPDWPYAPNYVEIDTSAGDGPGEPLRVHYVDEGPSDAAPILCLHGEPSWSYLYRHMIPVLTAAGHRVVAPDLVGFGRSDKLTDRTEYTYNRHVAWLRDTVERLDLRDITLVCQDWGGLLGLRVVAEVPHRFARVVAANTSLPTGDHALSDAFLAWQRFSQETPTFAVGKIVDSGCATDLAPEVVAAYDAPFPDESYKEAARQFPLLAPSTPDDPAAEANRAAWDVLAGWDKPFLCAFSDGDPVTAGSDRKMRRLIPGCEGQPHTTVEGAGHFLQEDKGPEFAAVVVDWLAGLGA